MPEDVKPFRIGLLLFPDITQLDMTGPYEVFTKFPGAEVHLVAKTLAPVTANGGMQILPTMTLALCPQLDVVCVPGGAGMNALLNDAETLQFLRSQAAGARYVTSVCTGALVLGAAGLLKGKRAATHWMSREMLREFGAIPVAARVVKDGNVITGGGVTAGIDFALTLAADAFGPDLAKSIQLAIEYNPQPPFDAGSPEGAGSEIADKARANAAQRQAERLVAVRQAAARLNARSEVQQRGAAKQGRSEEGVQEISAAAALERNLEPAQKSGSLVLGVLGKRYEDVRLR